ncbi:complement decay-accelerating factor isoform X1 [Balaenoptera acutorostrata]|uniref:Complement decay-accelerating factor isoform X1 n=1 Tax=Balaenoptera acutorostrata TaxID=9767 RepID=A0A383YMF3_BALAC|nr:complement decay-accelerating factor isoform X1 [Balaenoptera acutorostrata]
MSPARRSASAVLRLLGGLAPPLLLLLLCPPPASGDCGLPPDVPNAQPALGALTSFPKQSTVTYKCNEGFVKVPGKADSVVCLNNKWSEVAEFCNRSCDVPTRLLFASLKKSYTKQNYFPEGSTVEYDCRLGYIRDHSLSGKLTCLQNFTWSKPDEFCKKKSCANPREIKNGHVNITHDLLFGSSIRFSCNTGYKLVGATSSYCSLAGSTVEWSDPFPECQEILCPEPPEVDHGMIEEKQNSYAYRHSVTYKCMKGFTLHGESSIYCTVKDGQGEWSGPPPECKETFQIYKVTPAVQKPTRVHVPATKVPPTPQKSSTVNVSATRSPAVPRATTRFHAASPPKGGGSSPSVASIIASGCVAGTIIIGTIILVKIFWGSGKSGSYYTHENNKALNVKFHNLTVTGDATEVRPSSNLQQVYGSIKSISVSWKMSINTISLISICDY